MGFLFGKRASPITNNKESVAKVIELLNNGFSLFDINRRLVEIPEVRTAVNFIAQTISMVPFYHVRESPVSSTSNLKKIEYRSGTSFDRFLNVRANEFQSPQVFLTNIISRLLYLNNVFCLPEWDSVTGNLKAVYPLPVTHFEFEKVDGFEFMVFGELGTSFIYSDLIHLQRFPDIKQGNRKQAVYNYTDVVASMQLAAVKQLEASGKIKALLINRNGSLKSKDMKAELEEFKTNFLTAENTTGLGMVGGNYEVFPVEFNDQALNAEALKTLIAGIYNYFGMSSGILNFTATELEYQQFINTADPILKQITQEYTYKLFTDREILAWERIIYDKLHLEISTLQAKALFIDKAVYQGTMTRNEGRARVGLGWIEGGDELLTNKNAQAMADVTGGGDKKNG